jgi:hypothetical protein
MAVAAAFEHYYELVDSFEDVAAARQLERDKALGILASNRTLVEAGEAPNLIPVDALSTARTVLDTGRLYGLESDEYRERRAGLDLDCSRLVGEWYRKLKPEHFEPARHYFDEATQDFFSHGFSVGQMTENALVPLADDHEEEVRRVNEFVEDKTLQILRRVGKVALGDSMRTISECPDTAIEKYAEDQAKGSQHRGYWGYVPEIQKVMIRDIRPDSTTNDRFEEQVGLPGTYITHDIIQMALKRRGADVSGMDKTKLHGSQFIARDGLMDFVKLLDDVATEQWCTKVNGTEIFMGEAVPLGSEKDYDVFREQALERQESLRELSETTATFLLDLTESDIDPRKAPAHVEEFVKMQLLDLGKKDIEVAAQMFDEKTAAGLQQVANLEALGEYERAFELMQEVRQEAPGGGFCGAGSCGLEAVDVSGDEGQKLMQKLGASPGDKIVKDKERACRCGSKSVVYAYSSKKVTKYCEACGAYESKQSKVA